MNTLRAFLRVQDICQVEIVRRGNLQHGSAVLSSPKLSMICRGHRAATPAQQAAIRLALLDLGHGIDTINTIPELQAEG